MDISKLLFFDKKGEAYNLSWNEDGYWEGADYFLPVSTALFDNSNLFILEKVVSSGITSYKFPVMEQGSKFEIVWKTAAAKNNFFLFTVGLDTTGPEPVNYINQQASITVNYSDFGQSSGDLDVSYPFQINVAFTPAEEKAYSRVMQVYYTNGSGRNLVLEMTFYGEGEGEDERFRVWLENFGIRFNRADALLLKDYDLKESLSDWTQVNLARKQLLVNQDQVYPYVGTYKGMLNLINLLGYRDVLRVKEYWRDTDPTSSYYKKFAMVDVTDLMQLGDINKVNLIDDKGGLKSSKKFKKTEFLALAYQFTVATDNFDDDGLPEIEPTTEFTVDEIFFKLYGIAKKLEEEILPVNVIIRDIIGEFIYFNKFNLRNWIDEEIIEGFQINDVYQVQLLEPNTKALELKIRDIKTLYPKLSGISAFPEITYNDGPVEPYENSQIYPVDQIPTLINAITNYYEAMVNYDYWNGESNPADYGDDVSNKIGCPIVLQLYIPDFTLQELDGVSFNDFITASPTTSTTSNDVSTGSKTFSVVGVDSLTVGCQLKIYVTDDLTQYMSGTVTDITGSTVDIDITSATGTATGNTGWTLYLIDTHHTLENIRYRNGYEMEWIITGPKEYRFSRRGKIKDLVKIGHILPYTGEYTVLANVYDLQSGVSFDQIKITVASEEPVLQVFTKIQDRAKYDFASLTGLTIDDLGQSPLYDPFVNIVNPDGFGNPTTPVNSHYLNWYTYSNSWGVGSKLDEVKIFYPGEGFQPYTLSTNPKKKYWGTGSVKGQPNLKDYESATLGEMYHQDFSDLSYVGDTVDGFYLSLKSLNANTPESYIHSLQFGGFPELDISSQSPAATLQDLADYLSNTDSPGWSDYTYRIIGDRVYASAKLQSKTNHSILTALHKATVYDSGYSVSYPIDQNGLTISDTVISDSTLYTFTEIYEAPTVFATSGLAVGDRVRVMNLEGGYIDGVITVLEEDHFDVQADFANDLGTLGIFNVFWLERIYTFSRPYPAFSDSVIGQIQSALAQANLALDEDLLFLYSDFEDKLKRTDSGRPADASRIQYWINRGLVTYDSLPLNIYEDSVQIDLSLSETNYQALTLTSSTNVWQCTDNSPEGWTLSQDFYIRLDDSISAWEDDKIISLIFDSPIYLGSYSIRIVTDALNNGGSGVYGKTVAILTAADFPKAEGIPSKLAVNITCTDSNSFTFSVEKIKPVQLGYLPSYFDENSFTFSNIKATYDTLIIPTYHPVFIVISNLASNVETEWTLTDELGNTIINLQSPAFFVWRFNEVGNYRLTVTSTDIRTNEYRLNQSIAITSVLGPREYSNFIDSAIADRARILADS